MHYVYIVRCSDKTLYTGYTNDLDRRILKHNGELPGGARYTKARSPVALVYSEEFEEKSDALRREIEIKSLSRKEKELLILSA